MGHHKTYQYMDYRNPRRREKNVAERFQEVISRNSKFMKNINLHIQETQQIQVEKNSNLHLDTS